VEIFNSSGKHPKWVGDYSVSNINSFHPGDFSYTSWYPIASEEFPVKININITIY